MSADPITQLAAKHARLFCENWDVEPFENLVEAIAAALREQREQHVETLRMLWITAKRHELPEWFQDEIFEATASKPRIAAKDAATDKPEDAISRSQRKRLNVMHGRPMDEGVYPERGAATAEPSSVAPRRLETGIVQVDGDWPGIFIRGDNAMAYAMALKGLLITTEARSSSGMYRKQTEGLQEFLLSCNVHHQDYSLDQSGESGASSETSEGDSGDPPSTEGEL